VTANVNRKRTVNSALLVLKPLVSAVCVSMLLTACSAATSPEPDNFAQIADLAKQYANKESYIPRASVTHPTIALPMYCNRLFLDYAGGTVLTYDEYAAFETVTILPAYMNSPEPQYWLPSFSKENRPITQSEYESLSTQHAHTFGENQFANANRFERLPERADVNNDGIDEIVLYRWMGVGASNSVLVYSKIDSPQSKVGYELKLYRYYSGNAPHIVKYDNVTYVIIGWSDGAMGYTDDDGSSDGSDVSFEISLVNKDWTRETADLSNGTLTNPAFFGERWQDDIINYQEVTQ